MIERLKATTQNPWKPFKKIEIKDSLKIRKEFQLKRLSEFVTSNTPKFLDRFAMKTDFLEFDPSTWPVRDDYRDGFEFCKNIHVVNDAAERGVKLTTDCNDISTKDEKQKQDI